MLHRQRDARPSIELCEGKSSSDPTEAPIKGAKTKYGTEAVIFDMGGVIVPSPGPVFQEYEIKKKLPRGTIVRLIFDEGPKGAWQRLERGELSVAAFGREFSKECSSLVGREVDMSGLIPSFHSHSRRPYQQLLDAVKCVRAEGLETAIVTNNWFNMSLTESYLPVDFALFDVIIESCKLGIRKPDPRIYETCLTQLGVQAERAIFLDDVGSNLKAAKEMGIRTIKVTGPDQAVRELEEELGFCLRGYMDGTVVVPERLQLPVDTLQSYLNTALKLDFKEEPTIRCFGHGNSNPTYFVKYGGENMVLRKKPPGKLLPSAHAVEREYRVMKSVGTQGVPVPRMLGLCVDQSVLGTPFYVMEHMSGRIFLDHLLTDCTPEERRMIYLEMVNTLCKIHSVDIKAAELDDFGKPSDYLLRNFTRWARQYEASKTTEIESMNKVMEWIPAHLPDNERLTVVHGDYRLDNLIFHKSRPEITGVIDWELSTLGDPLTDLAGMCICYYLPEGHPKLSSFVGRDVEAMGIPSPDEILNAYCEKMDIPKIENWDFYLAFIFFRNCAIAQGVYKRAISGQSSSPDSVGSVASFAKELANKAWEIASNSNLKPTNQPAVVRNQHKTATKPKL